MNKIIASIVLVIALIVVINKITEIVYKVEKPEKSAYQVAGASSSSNKKSSSESLGSDETKNILTLLASSSAADGNKVFLKCAACHSVAKGGKNKIGPALWGVLGKQVGSNSSYKYSNALSNYGKQWTFEEMNGFLTNPKDWIKGTKMSFTGLKKETDRAAVILYMNKNTDNPLPLH